jgi:hypothetical protein
LQGEEHETLVLGIAMLMAAQFFTTERADAYSISVDCDINFVPPPSRPYQNATCFYSWAPGLDNWITKGSWEANLHVAFLPYLLDTITMPMFTFASYTPPHTAWIQCANLVGYYDVTMTGRGWKYYIGTLTSPGGWIDVLFATDTAHPYVSTPVTCP